MVAFNVLVPDFVPSPEYDGFHGTFHVLEIYGGIGGITRPVHRKGLRGGPDIEIHKHLDF